MILALFTISYCPLSMCEILLVLLIILEMDGQFGTNAQPSGTIKFLALLKKGKGFPKTNSLMGSGG